MPLIRDYTHSDKIEALTPQAEVLFVRLLLKADVAGNFYAHPELIKSICFPLKTNVRTADIVRWLKELSTPASFEPGKNTSAKNTALLRMYTGNGKPYLHIFGYGQKLKYGKPKFPPPPEVEVEEESEDEDEIENARASISETIFFTIGQERIINKPSLTAQSDEYLQRTEQILMNGLKGINPEILWKEFDSKYSYYEFTNRNHFYNSLSKVGEEILKTPANSNTPKFLTKV